MKQRRKKSLAGGLHIALNRAHSKLASEAYELGLSRRAIEALQRHGQQERERAQGRAAGMAHELEILRRRMAQVVAVVGDACFAVGQAPARDMRIEERDFMSAMRLSLDFEPGRNPFDPSARVDSFISDRTHSYMMRMLRIRAVRDRLEGMTHIRVSLRDQTVGYALSDNTIDYAPIECLRDTIAAEISARLAHELRPDQRRRQSEMPTFRPRPY